MGFTMIRLILFLGISLLATFVYADDSNPFSLTTTDFSDKGAMPVLYTCDGRDISPNLAWINTPLNTHSFAIILSDPDAPGGTWYHWVVYNIPSSVKDLPQGISHFPSGTHLGKNSWNKTNYNGPCPPKGAMHRYIFTLYALDTELNVSDADANTVLEASKGHVLGQAVISAVYSRF